MAAIEWKITHHLRDGTELKPGQQFPDTAENRATLERVRAICRNHTKGGEKHE